MQENSVTVTQDTGLWNKTQTAKRLGICVRTLDNRMAENLIPYVKIGDAVRFIPADIEAFIQKHRIGG
jgi:Bacterial regulatory protein, Fis family.